MKQLFKKPSYYLISSAMDGNEKAIEKLLAFYDPYISKCCLRSLYDEYGNVYIVVDMELKGRIREVSHGQVTEHHTTFIPTYLLYEYGKQRNEPKHPAISYGTR